MSQLATLLCLAGMIWLSGPLFGTDTRSQKLAPLESIVFFRTCRAMSDYSREFGTKAALECEAMTRRWTLSCQPKPGESAARSLSKGQYLNASKAMRDPGKNESFGFTFGNPVAPFYFTCQAASPPTSLKGLF